MGRIKDLFFDIPWFFVESRTVLHRGFAEEHAVLRELVPPRAKIFDLGCGTGQHSTVFPPGTYYGVDLEGKNLAFARRRYPDQVFRGFDADLRAPFPDGTFDWGMSFSTLHHVPPEGEPRFVREVHRLLRPGGRFLLWDHFPIAAQGRAGRFFVAIDRGRHARMPEEARRILGGELELERESERQSGPYRCYQLVFHKT